MADVVILARGGTGRELVELLQPEHRVLGFLDDRDPHETVLGPLSDYASYLGRAFLVSGLGSYRSMRRRREILEAMPLEAFMAYRSRDAVIYPSAVLGAASLVFPLAVASSQVRLGIHTLAYHGCILAHDAVVGDYSIVSNGATLSGGVVVGENCYIGAGAVVLEGLAIGAGSIVAAGATVVSDVPAGTIYIAPGRNKPNHYA